MPQVRQLTSALVIQNVRSDDSVMYKDIDGAFRCRMVIAISSLGDADPNGAFRSGLEVQVRETGTSEWRQSTLAGPGALEVSLYDVEVGTEYDFRCRYLYSNGEIMTWVSSWIEYNDDGTVNTTHTSHTVQGNLRLPPDCTALTISQTITGSMLFLPASNWTPMDLLGYEIRYILGFDHTDWSTMTPLTLSSSAPFESSALEGGDYTFAVKLLTYARDPSGDNITTFPKRSNESTNAFFANFSIVDPRPAIVLLRGSTETVAVTATPAIITNYVDSGMSPAAINKGWTFDAAAGTIIAPSAGTHIVRLSAIVIADPAVANNSDLLLYAGRSITGDAIVCSYFVAQSGQTDASTLQAVITFTVQASEVITLKLGATGVGGNLVLLSNSFEIEEVVI